MASFEPEIIVYGSPNRISSAQFRFPITLSFAFDIKTLEDFVNVQPQLTDIELKRYFLILLDPIENRIGVELEKNHRIVSIYYSERFPSTNSFKQLTLDVTSDIIQFLTLEGEKQLKFERISLVSIYFKQARVLKEWAMTSFRAEPCHILLVPLNSSKEKLNEIQRRLEETSHQLGYSSIKIRQLNDFIPQSARFSTLLPYAKQLFEYEKPSYLVRIIQKLSPIRLYVYGNQLTNLREWNQLMIENEQSVMNDEDNWCAFIQSEPLDDEVKWNFAFVLGKTWKVNRVSPLDYDRLVDDPRFQSALFRAQRTFAERQNEVTSQIFDWYDECLKLNYLYPEPRSIDQIAPKKRQRDSKDVVHLCRFRDLSFLDYPRLDQIKTRSIAFIWLDEILVDCPQNLHQAIRPCRWQFFSNVSSVVSFIENQIRDGKYVFLVSSGSLGHEFFSTPFSLKNQIYAAFIYCAQLQPNLKWSEQFANIRGVFNDSIALAQQIQTDYEKLQRQWTKSSSVSTPDAPAPRDFISSLPVTIYNFDEIQQFLAHQRTIDNLLCMPHNDESKMEMIVEFRRIFHDNPSILAEIDVFEGTYHSNAAVQWYTRDSFVWRTINQILRSSDAEAMFRFRYILTDIYSHLNETHQQRRFSFNRNSTEMFYRGQLMTADEFERFQNLRGNIISINTFLSTTSSMQIALLYAGKYFQTNEMIPVVFSIETNFSTKTRPFANISPYSLFPDEDETLFCMGCVFRIGKIRLLQESDTIWLIDLKMLNHAEYEDFQLTKVY